MYGVVPLVAQPLGAPWAIWRTMTDTGMRIPRMQARPPIIFGSKVIRSNLIVSSGIAPGTKPSARRILPHGQGQLALSDRLGGVLQGVIDIGGPEVRVGLEDLRLGHAIRYQPDHRGDGNAQSADARHTVHLLGIDRNAGELHGTVLEGFRLEGSFGVAFYLDGGPQHPPHRGAQPRRDLPRLPHPQRHPHLELSRAAALRSARIAYAATDAWACRELYLRFRSLGLL